MSLALSALLLAPAWADPGQDQAPLQLGRTYRYSYIQREQFLGMLDFTLTRRQDSAGRLRYQLVTHYELSRPPTDTDKLEATLTLSPSLIPIWYEKQQTVEAGGRPESTGTFDARFDFLGEKIHVEIERDERDFLEADYYTSKDILALDTNCVGQLSLILGALPLAEKERHTVRIFHLSLLRPLNLVVKRVGRDNVTVGGTPYDCWELELLVDGVPLGKCWLSDREKRLILLIMRTGGAKIGAVD